MENENELSLKIFKMKKRMYVIYLLIFIIIIKKRLYNIVLKFK